MNQQEEQYLKRIISSCELILKDLSEGSVIDEIDFCNLAYVNGIVFRIHQKVLEQSSPSELKA
jgi:hypothetical protein